MIEKLLNFLGYSKAKHLETVTGGTVIDPGTGFEYIAAGTTINGVFSDVSGQCINIRSNALAFSEWNIYRKRGDNEPELVDTNHWANLLFRDPESESINFTYYKTLCQWLDKDGNVYLRPWNPGFENREPNRLDILDSSRMQIIEFSETDYYYYYSDRFGNHYKFAPDEILHVKQYYPGTSAEPKGIGLSTIALAAILQNRKISEYISAFVTNNNQADVYLKPIVETMNTISNESYEKAQQLGKSINTNARMPNVAGVMPSGFEMENISDNNISNSTIDIIKLQELVQNTVANTFGIPMPLITGLSQNYATADITRLNAIDTAIKPILSQFEQSFTKLLEKYDPELLFRFATPTVEPSNADKDRKTLMYLTNGIISINEQRISEGLEPIEGGDEPRIAGRPISEPAEEKPVEAKPEDEEPK
ncbi:MAG: phage portal protein, partial [PVC group bacterium]|nr:phage portal protein [PVC group bacterium]